MRARVEVAQPSTVTSSNMRPGSVGIIRRCLSGDLSICTGQIVFKTNKGLVSFGDGTYYTSDYMVEILGPNNKVILEV